MITPVDFGSKLLTAAAAIIVTVAAMAVAIVPATPAATTLIGAVA